MAQKDLRPMNTLTEAEQKAITSAGGKASGESRRRRKAMREELEVLLNLAVPSAGAKTLIRRFGVETDSNVQTAILVKICQQAMAGDLDAAKFLRDTIGEKPGDSIAIDGGVAFTFSHPPEGATADDISG